MWHVRLLLDSGSWNFEIADGIGCDVRRHDRMILDNQFRRLQDGLECVDSDFYLSEHDFCESICIDSPR